MNLMLVAFNIVPGFPLDGGRVLRAALWGLWGSLSAATRVASGVGSFFGTMVIVMGFLWIFAYDNFVGGLWFVLIGFFLRSAARTSYQQLLLRQAVEGVKARDLMSLQLIWVSPDMPVVEAVDEIMLPRGLSEVPVTDNGRLLGELSLARLRAIDRSGWEKLYVADVMSRESLTQSVSPEEEALKVLMLLGQTERFLPCRRAGRARRRRLAKGSASAVAAPAHVRPLRAVPCRCKFLFVTPEVAPFAKVGGLADVVALIS